MARNTAALEPVTSTPALRPYAPPPIAGAHLLWQGLCAWGRRPEQELASLAGSIYRERARFQTRSVQDLPARAADLVRF
jgi:hypothetical protein